MMQKITLKSILLTLIAALVVSGCAKPHATDDSTSIAKPPSDMAIAAPQPTLAEPPSSDMSSAQVAAAQVVLEQVYFDYDQSTLSDQARATLATNATILQIAPALKVSIEGHCDDRGSDEYNLALGERRAQTVRAYLVSLGIAPERLVTISYGEEMPVEKGATEMAWAKNRRAEFKMIN